MAGYLDWNGNPLPNPFTDPFKFSGAGAGTGAGTGAGRGASMFTSFDPSHINAFNSALNQSYTPHGGAGTWGGLMTGPFPQGPSSPNAPNTLGLKDRTDKPVAAPPVTPLPSPGPPGYKPTPPATPTIGGNIRGATPAPPPAGQVSVPKNPNPPNLASDRPPKPTMGTPTPTQPGEPVLTGPAPPKPPGFEGVPDAAWNDITRWVNDAKAQGADYSFLLQHPDLIMQYRNFVGTDTSGARNGIDFVDWLQHMHPNEFNNPLAGRQGFDTFLYTDANGTQRGYGQGTGAPQPGLGQPVDDAAARYQRRQWYLDHIQGTNLDPNDPANFVGGIVFDQYGQLKSAAPAPAPATPAPTTPTTPGAPVPAPGGSGAGPVPGGEGVPGGTGGGQGTAPAPTPAPAPDSGDETQRLIDQFKSNFGAHQPDIESLLNPMFSRQQQRLSQSLNAEAALTPGRLQSGGYGENKATAMAELGGQQSATLATALQKQQELQMNQNTQVMQLATQAGMQKYITDINNDLELYKVRTNDDLQRYLNGQDNALKRYGIDAQAVWERYSADQNLKGNALAAQASVNAAALHAAATAAAGKAAADASRANAQLQFELGMSGLGVDRERNIGNFILGLLGINIQDMNVINGILSGIPTGTVVGVRP
jgi:hypothetical protein